MWDRQTHSRPLHRRMSDDHLRPSCTDKMRIHLAEESLDVDMFNLMQHYQVGVGLLACFDVDIQTY